MDRVQAALADAAESVVAVDAGRGFQERWLEDAVIAALERELPEARMVPRRKPPGFVVPRWDPQPDVFAGNAPLWFYVLREAEVRGNGRLGPVGGRIVAEVLLGLLKGDHFSYVSVEPNWTPSLGEGDFRMPDLVRFVQE